MNIISNWKLTYDPAGTPVVLLAYNEELAEEPELGFRRGLEVVTIPYGTPFLRPTRNDVYEVAIGMIRSSASDAYARRDMINMLTDTHAATVRKAMRLEASGVADHYWQWSAAFIHSASVKRLPADGGTGVEAWLLRFGFTAVGLTKTVIS